MGGRLVDALWQTKAAAERAAGASLPDPLLVLGCGRRPVEGATNHNLGRYGRDGQRMDWVDVARDLDCLLWGRRIHRELGAGWGWTADHTGLYRTEEAIKGLYGSILALDLLEHIKDVLAFCNECWELLEPGGLLVVRAGAHDNPASYTDPTHRHWFTRESLDFLDPTTRLGAHYGAFYVDSLYRPVLPWYMLGVGRSNADGRWPTTGDWLWLLQKAEGEC